VGVGSLPPLSRLDELERRLGYEFSRKDLLEQALTHGSRAHELGDLSGSNERLEFLGDAVLDLLISESLMKINRDADEGALSRSRSELVNAAALARRARSLDLGRWIRLGKSEERSGGREKESILANALEAVFGALYLDGGLEPVRVLVAREFRGEVAEVAKSGRTLGDAKSRLQEFLHARGQPGPVYETAAECGPPHAREFVVEVSVAGNLLGSARARTKRAAEQGAAERALLALGETRS
jgi:ribonuclease-3